MGEFIELHDIHNNNPILIRKNEIKSVYVFGGKGKNTSVIVGNREFDVVEDYERIRGMLVSPEFIEIKYSEEDKKRIEKLIDRWSQLGCTTFSALGMTDDEWHRAIAGLSDN